MFRGWRRPDKGFFDEIEREFEEMNELINRMARSAGTEPLIYGFSMHVGPDGVPHMERFGNVRPTAAWGDNVREPFTSSMIDEKSNEFRITAEMQGVQKEEIEINATENEVIIKTEGGERKYYKKIATREPIDPDSASAKYNNGVLEITLKLKGSVEMKGKKVKIE